MFEMQTHYLVIWVALASLITFLLYRHDKRLAVDADPRRISEKTLLIWSLVGGWPGGWLASKIYHHKTRKLSYRLEFALAAMANVASIVAAVVLRS